MYMSQYELLQAHIKTLYTIDSNSNLCLVNEPWNKSVPACKFFLGRTMDGHVLPKFRFDVPMEVQNKINDLCQSETIPKDADRVPKHLKTYLKLLKSESHSISLCFYVPHIHTCKNECTIVEEKNVRSLTENGFDWLSEEIEFVQPCVGVVSSNQIVSVCRSVRTSETAHEAGIETLKAFRGKGYALDVLAVWAKILREQGIIPLYSTGIENISSQRVAEKAALYNYGIGFSVE